MALPLFKERRFNPRKRLTGLLPGRLIHADTGNNVFCKPVDISATGIGIVVAAQFEEGTQINLVLDGREIELTVAYIAADFGKQDLYRHGLVAKDSRIDLEKIFIDSGCLV